MNNKLMVPVCILCGLILSALVAMHGKLLLLALPFLIYLLLGVIRSPNEITLIAERRIDKQDVVAQEPFDVHVRIQNQGSAAVNLYLADELFPSMTILDGKTSAMVCLPAGSFAELDYAAKAARGVYSWRMIHACASDPFGLFELERHVPAYGDVFVRPAPMLIRSVSLKPKSTLHAAGPISARLAGPGTDFWGIREYRAGDPLRRLNWRLAARHPHRLFTNEYEQEEIADFGLILDARRKTDDDETESALFEYSVSTVAALSEHLLKYGNRVSLLIFGEGYSSLFPGYGEKQLMRVLRNLTRARLGTNVPMSYLQYFPVRLFPSRSQIVIISLVDPRDVETYATLRAFGYDVLLISPDLVEYSARKLSPTVISKLAIRAARVERALALKQLSKLGVDVINWQVNQSLETILQKTTRHMNCRRNI